ncbi:MFS transporter [Streptomyces mirabilis]|uniref:MFS transporter n=1 Tax=Streptomyces mirabilis TaxID=68239 RepID=UPI0036DD4F2F
MRTVVHRRIDPQATKNHYLMSRLTSDHGARNLGPAGIMVLLIGVFMPQADYFIVNVALPTIDQSFHASSGALELIVAGYGTVYAALLVVGGRLGDIVGRRRVFAIGLAGFTTASLACGMAPDVWFLLGARLLQGASAALIVPQVLATFHATLQGAELHRAQSLYGAAAGLAIAVGQLAGGLLVTINIAGTTWRPIFWVNVPIGLATLIAVPRFVPPTRAKRPSTIDTRGTLLFAATLVALLVPLAEGQTDGWPAWTWILLACAPILAFITIVFERRFESSGGVPLLPPSLLKTRSMHRGLLLQLLFMLGYGALMFVFALTVQDGLHAGPLQSGLAIVPMAIAFFIGSLLTPKVVRRFGGRMTVALGATVNGIGLFGLVVVVTDKWPHVSLLSLAPALAVVGFGQALVFGSLFRLVLSDVPDHHAGVGGGVLVTIQQSGLALGVATIGTLYLSLEAHGISQAFAAAGAAQIAIMAVLALASRAMPPSASRSPEAE